MYPSAMENLEILDFRHTVQDASKPEISDKAFGILRRVCHALLLSKLITKREVTN
jgi:hypothetical protein